MDDSARSASLADAVVELVVLLLNLTIERGRARGLGNARPRHGCAGRGHVVLIQKMPRRRFAQLWGDKIVVLPVGRNARGNREEEGDDYRLCHDPKLANEDPNETEIGLICLGFKLPTR